MSPLRLPPEMVRIHRPVRWDRRKLDQLWVDYSLGIFGARRAVKVLRSLHAQAFILKQGDDGWHGRITCPRAGLENRPGVRFEDRRVSISFPEY